MKRLLHDVRPGQIWLDRDKRSYGGHRRVIVTKTARAGEKVTVTYQQVTGLDNRQWPGEFTSRYDRFQRAFDLVRDIGR